MILLYLSVLAATADVNKANTKDDNPVICKAISRTGSRMAPRKVCKPESEWQVMSASTRRDLGDIQRRAFPESIPSF